VRGVLLMYADKMTPSMTQAIEATARRREVQRAYNLEHGITPETVRREITSFMLDPSESDYVTVPILRPGESDPERLEKNLEELRSEMLLAAENLDFERAAELRDRIKKLQGKPAEPMSAREQRKRPGTGRRKR
jgi:excinuclease ABC subunit B